MLSVVILFDLKVEMKFLQMVVYSLVMNFASTNPLLQASLMQ